MRHRAESALLSESAGGGVSARPDKTDSAVNASRPRAADRRRIRHRLGHLGARAVSRVHRNEGGLRQCPRNAIRVMRRNTRRANLLQEERLKVGKMHERSLHIQQRLARADPFALAVTQNTFNVRAARLGDRLNPVNRDAGRRKRRTAQENRVGHLARRRLGAKQITRAAEINVGLLAYITLVARALRNSQTGSLRRGRVAGHHKPNSPRGLHRRHCAYDAENPRQEKPVPKPDSRSAAGRNACGNGRQASPR